MAHVSQARSKAPAQCDQTAVLVLGMHRSGTSAMARVLSLLGCSLPRTLMPVGHDNELGHWESDVICQFNDELLDSAGTQWNDWQAFNPRWYLSPLRASYVKRAVALLAAEYDGSPLFVIKDPRGCRLAPFWLEALKRARIRPAVVMPVRNPVEVARSLAARDGLDVEHSQLLWLRHVLDAEAASRGMSRLVTSYDQLLDDWRGLAARLEQQFGFTWPRRTVASAREVDEFLRPGLRHHRVVGTGEGQNPSLSGWAQRSYSVLLRWAEAGEDSRDYAELDSLRQAFDEASPVFARLIDSVVRNIATSDSASIRVEPGIGDSEASRSGDGIAQAGAEISMPQVSAETDPPETEQTQPHFKDATAQVAMVEDQRRNAEALAERLIGDKVALEQALGAAQAELEALQTSLAEAERRHADATSSAQANSEHRKRLEDALEHSTRELAQMRAAVAETETAMAAKTAEARAADAACESAQAAFQVVAAQLAEQTRAHADELSSTLRRKTDEAQAAEARFTEALARQQAASAEALQAARERLALADNMLRQRLEEIEQTRRERDGATQSASLLGAEVQALTAKLRDSEGWVFRLAGERRNLELAASQLRRTMAGYDRKLAAAAALQQRSEGALDRAQRRADGRDAELSSLAELLRQREIELQAAQAEVAQVRQREAALREASVAAASATAASAEAGKAELQGEIASLQQARGAVEAQLGTRFDELATLTKWLRAEEDRAEHLADEAEWLRQVNAALATQSKWWSIMPPGWQRARNARRLQRKGLFDAEAYLSRNADVREAGHDPLRHYILYGMREGRAR